MTQNTEKLLQRPLYIFDLPEELLFSLQLHQHLNGSSLSDKHVSTDAETTENAHSRNEARNESTNTDENSTGLPAATSCNLCGLAFSNLLEQRGHVRSDLHGYNLKQKLRGKPPVSEADFDRLVGDLDESLSGSDSSNTSDDEDTADTQSSLLSKSKDSTLSALLKKQAKIVDGDAVDAPAMKRSRNPGKPPLVWLSSPKLPADTSLGVYRANFTRSEQDREKQCVEHIKSKQLSAKPPPGPQPKPAQEDNDEAGVPLPLSMIQPGTSASGPTYFLCMIGGGHFAAMIVSLTPKLMKKAGVEDRSATVIAHKTFHRYTTRRKQGGSQSANDNSKGNAHSAGSSLRRYNETALTDEVRALLSEWRDLITSAELLFIRATGSTNRRTLFGPYPDQVLSHKDERMRGFPFSTRRATQSELMRAFVELTRVKVRTIDEAALAAEAAAAAAAVIGPSTPTSSTTSATPKPTISKADEEATLHTTQLQSLIRRSKAPALLSYLTSNSLSSDYSFFPPAAHHHAPTPLHLSASLSSAACVTALLLKAHADPTTLNADGKTPFDIAGDRPTHDAFRLARTALGEAAWSWSAAHVGPALTQSDVDSRLARERDEKAHADELERERRKAETQRLRDEDAARQDSARDRKFGKGLSLRAAQKVGMTPEERRADEARGLTDEMRLKLEREKRARAAEERMKRLQGR